MIKIFNPVNINTVYNGGFGCVFFGNKNAFNSVLFCGNGNSQNAVYTADSSVKRYFAYYYHIVKVNLDLSICFKYRQQNRKVVDRAFLFSVRRG